MFLKMLEYTDCSSTYNLKKKKKREQQHNNKIKMIRQNHFDSSGRTTATISEVQGCSHSFPHQGIPATIEELQLSAGQLLREQLM